MQVSKPALFSALFSADMVSSAFDAAIVRDSENGRVNAMFLASLKSAYGLELPSGPVLAVKAINQYLTLEKMPVIKRGIGAHAGSISVINALHQLALALQTAGKVKNLPVVAALPVWADEIKVKAKKEAAKVAKTKAPKKDKSEAVTPMKGGKVTTPPTLETAPVDTPEIDTAPAKIDLTMSYANIQAAVNVVISAAKGGALTETQIVALRAALDAVKSKPAVKKDTVKM